ncbi:Hypothetical predicted protein [Mytilus galloprovincialis]|uniref:Uncharacterized protein n=1 Tax=Mytilus galloprovincialis TaxID=29158 RepID=A0A8B6G221_MYTGA|nr:Hypothetical predicted protein [Mytilus galloprovincialis]
MTRTRLLVNLIVAFQCTWNRKRTLHRNLFLQIGDLPTNIEKDDDKNNAPIDHPLEEADELAIAPEQPRRRGIFPTQPQDPPMSTRPLRNRKPPKYLEDYDAYKQTWTQQED